MKRYGEGREGQRRERDGGSKVGGGRRTENKRYGKQEEVKKK